MNAEVFAEWLRRQGHVVLRTESTFWHDHGPRIYQAFPYHWLVKPSESELVELLRSQKAIGLRYSAPLDASIGAVSYHVVFDSAGYELASLPKKVRHDVSKGQKAASIERVSLARLAREGWALRWDTLQRQGRTKAETPEWWQTLCETAEGLPGIEAWAALVAGELAATVITIRCDEWMLILYQQSRTAYLPLGVNNALAFAVTRHALEHGLSSRVFYGLHSLDASPTVDDFKFRMAFRPQPVRQRVVFHPSVAPMFNRASHGLVKMLARGYRNSRLLSKAEGMMRFYLEGNRPIGRQTIPQCLLDTVAVTSTGGHGIHG